MLQHREKRPVPSTQSILALVQKKFDDVGLNWAQYTLGSDYRDDSCCFYSDGSDYCVGWNELGKQWEAARFKDEIAAAEYLVFLLLKGTPKVSFPQIDWIEYASLS
jgi:hypothetical protein